MAMTESRKGEVALQLLRAAWSMMDGEISPEPEFQEGIDAMMELIVGDATREEVEELIRSLEGAAPPNPAQPYLSFWPPEDMVGFH